MEYRVKAKPSSDAGTEPEYKVSSDAGTEAGTNNVVPPSESEKSARGAAQNGANNAQGAPTRTRTFQKVLINGSEKRKKKNAKKNSGNEPEKVSKQDSKVDGSKKQAGQQALPVYPREEEKKTLAEYEKIRAEKMKTSEASKTEVRKVTAEEFEGMQILEKKKLDGEEAVIKVEKSKVNKEASKKEEVQRKEAATKDGKPKKVTVSLQNLEFRQPKRVTYNAQDGSFTRRFDGPFQGGNRERGIENGKAAFRNEADGNNGGGAPRGTYNGRGNDASRGDFSGSRDGYRGNGGYGYGRANGGYGYGRGNGGYQGNGDYNRQQQSGNVGRFHQERAGNGGYYPQRQGGHYQRRPGNDTYYQQRGNSGFRRSPSPAPEPALLGVEDLSKFPALSAPASTRSAAPASALAPARSAAHASAPDVA